MQLPGRPVRFDAGFEEARGSCESEYRAATAACDAQAMALAWSGLVALCFHARDFSRSVVLREGADAVRRELVRLPPNLQARTAVAGFAVTVLIGSDAAELDFWELGAFEHVQREDDDVLWLALGVAACGAVLWLGRPTDRLCRALRRIDSAAHRVPGAAQGWFAARRHCGLVYTDPALGLGDILDDMGSESVRTENVDPGIASIMFLQDLTQDRFDAARAFVRRASARAEMLGTYDEWLLSFYRSWLQIEAGDSQMAAHDAAQACALSARLDLSYPRAWSACAMARALVPATQAGACGRQLAQARLAARRTGNVLLLGLCRLTAALRALHRRRTAAAIRLARAGLRYMETTGAFRPPLLARRDVERLLECLRMSGDEETALRLQAHHAIVMPSPSGHVRPAVEIRCLGSFSVHRDGQPLRWSRKPPRRPLALLKALIASGPDGVLAGRLGDSLWPELDADRARKAMSTALYRLRGMLGEDAVVLDAGRLRLDARSVWVDVYAFELTACRSDSALETIALYNGPFLADEDEGWVLSARHRISELYRGLVRSAGERLLASGDWQATLALHREALRHDPLAEVFYQGAIAACRAGGLRAEASAFYERCREELAEKLGLSPSAQTMTLYASAIRPDGPPDSR